MDIQQTDKESLATMFIDLNGKLADVNLTMMPLP